MQFTLPISHPARLSVYLPLYLSLTAARTAAILAAISTTYSKVVDRVVVSAPISSVSDYRYLNLTHFAALLSLILLTFP